MYKVGILSLTQIGLYSYLALVCRVVWGLMNLQAFAALEHPHSCDPFVWIRVFSRWGDWLPSAKEGEIVLEYHLKLVLHLVRFSMGLSMNEMGTMEVVNDSPKHKMIVKGRDLMGTLGGWGIKSHRAHAAVDHWIRCYSYECGQTRYPKGCNDGNGNCWCYWGKFSLESNLKNTLGNNVNGATIKP